MEIDWDKVRATRIEKGGKQNTLKSLLVVLICLLTIYAPIELTRVIVAWGLSSQFIFEIAFVWLFYALALVIISIGVRNT